MTVSLQRFFARLGLILSLGCIAWATTPVVSVTSPTNGSSVKSPVHYVASASSSACSKGIAAMRIYSAPGVNAYTVDSSTLDIAISLAPGTYNTVVQAWDNCGGVGKAPVTITVTGGRRLPPPRFLYSSDELGGKIYGYVIDPSSGSLAANGQGPVSAHSSPTRVAVDKGGFRLYVINVGSNDVSAYFIDRRNGHLSPVPGSPFPVGAQLNDVRVHPSGHFVYVTAEKNSVYVFAVQPDGSLKLVPGSPFPTQDDPWGLTITPDGKHAYVSDYTPGQIDAFSINQNDGTLTPVPGSPYTPQPVGQGGCTTGALDITTDAKGKFLIVPRACVSVINVYKIDPTTGTLTEVRGSPFPLPYPQLEVPAGVAVDPLDRFVYVADEFCDSGCSAETEIWKFSGSSGFMTYKSSSTGLCGQLPRTDPSGEFLYGIGNNSGGNDCSGSGPSPAIWGFTYGASSGLMVNVPGAPFLSPNSDFQYSDGLAVTP